MIHGKSCDLYVTTCFICGRGPWRIHIHLLQDTLGHFPIGTFSSSSWTTLHMQSWKNVFKDTFRTVLGKDWTVYDKNVEHVVKRVITPLKDVDTRFVVLFWTDT